MRSGRLAAAALLLVPALARADTWEEVDVTCLVCGKGFHADDWASTNNIGGVDRDFAEHEVGNPVFILSCWTCPRCGYTGFVGDFDPEKAPKLIVEKLKKENTLRPARPLDPKAEHTSEIPSWVRYDLWIQVLRLDPETKAGRLAKAHMRAAQTQRFEWDVLDRVPGFEERHRALLARIREGIPREDAYAHAIACARAFEKLADDAASGLVDGDRQFARVAAAVLYKERGEDPDAQRIVADLRKGKLEKGLEVVVAEVEERIAREREYLARAVPFFEERLAEAGLDPKEATSIRYLLGIIHRKLGDSKKALEFLEPLLASEDVQDGFREWITDEIAKARG